MADPLFSVEDMVVLVSGGTRGIGRALAEEFARRDARVFLTGRERGACEEAAGEMAGLGRHAVRGVACDVRERSSIRRLVEVVMGEGGRIDVLVNVAGVNRRKPALEITEDDYDFVMTTNLKGAFFLSQEVGRVMVEGGGGSQINVASLNTDRPLTHVAPYALSKAGMGAMTRALAMEWGPRGVRVNGLAPGFILTDLTQALWADPGMQRWGKANTPQGRLGRPADLAGTAIFLASQASAFMTGQMLYVDGGFTAGWAWPIPGSAVGAEAARDAEQA